MTRCARCGHPENQHLNGWCLWVGSGHSCDCDRGPAAYACLVCIPGEFVCPDCEATP